MNEGKLSAIEKNNRAITAFAHKRSDEKNNPLS